MVDGKVASPRSMFSYVLNVKKLKQDLANSEWKIGFLKRLLVIPFPYYKIYNFLKKKLKKKV